MSCSELRRIANAAKKVADELKIENRALKSQTETMKNDLTKLAKLANVNKKLSSTKLK